VEALALASGSISERANQRAFASRGSAAARSAVCCIRPPHRPHEGGSKATRSMTPAIGFDFGTTNCAIAVVAPDGAPRLAHFSGPDGDVATFRSILYFDRDEKGAPVEIHAGPGALLHYLEREEHDGRLVQSLKSFLTSRLFSATRIFDQTYRLEDLIALLARRLREGAERSLGLPIAHAVVGRPVHFVGSTSEEDDALAQRRLGAALHNAGFREITFEYEPVGAAYHYERGLEHDERILIADFGGGTSDFSLLWVGPSYRDRRSEAILGHDGVDVAGDAFDGKIVRHKVAPLLGRGSEFESLYGRRLPVPGWIYVHLERWHHVSFLKSPRTMQLLLDLRREALDPARLDALVRIVEQDLGFMLYRAVERAKRELSESGVTRLRLEHDVITLDAEVTRAEFDGWIAEELAKIAGCVDRLLAHTGLTPDHVDRVFMTGGSSFVPAVRALFERRFGADKLRGGQELTSVASGLALRAAAVAEA
jgi:hypothetical chaperone protein